MVAILCSEPSIRAMPSGTATDQGPRLTLLNFRATSREREQLQALAARAPQADELAVLKKLDTLNAARTLLNLDETVTRE